MLQLLWLRYLASKYCQKLAEQETKEATEAKVSRCVKWFWVSLNPFQMEATTVGQLSKQEKTKLGVMVYVTIMLVEKSQITTT